MAQYTSGSFGVAAAGANNCFQGVSGGAGEISVVSTRAGSAASASLATGVLTALSTQAPGYPSAALWETVTFAGLPSGGGVVTETLTLTGSITGSSAGGSAKISVGNPLNPSFSASRVLSSSTVFPSSVTLSFTAMNGVPYLIYAALSGSNPFSGGFVDLEDPPTLSLVVPQGTTYTTASGVFANIAPVPEPSAQLMLLAGLTLMAGLARRGRRD